MVNVRGEQSYLSPDTKTGLTVNNAGVFYNKTIIGSTSLIACALPAIACMGEVNADGFKIRQWAMGGISLKMEPVTGTTGKYKIAMGNVFLSETDYIVSLTSRGNSGVYVYRQTNECFYVYSHS